MININLQLEPPSDMHDNSAHLHIQELGYAWCHAQYIFKTLSTMPIL